MKILAPTSAIEKKEFTYEVKFLLPEPAIEPALTWARTNLVIDPHITRATSDCYRVTSLYFDTPELHTFRRQGSFARSKFRVRRYADETGVFLERKMKTRGIVGKRRVRVSDGDIHRLGFKQVDAQWVGSWFHRRLLMRNLQPRCQITYERVARVGTGVNGLMRMTLDRAIRCVPTDQIQLAPVVQGQHLLDGQAILELKFQVALPGPFKELVDSLGVQPAAVSKYRLSIEALGMAPINGHAHPEMNADGHASTPRPHAPGEHTRPASPARTVSQSAPPPTAGQPA